MHGHSHRRIDKIATSLWTGVSYGTAAAAAEGVAAPILDGVRVIVSS